MVILNGIFETATTRAVLLTKNGSRQWIPKSVIEEKDRLIQGESVNIKIKECNVPIKALFFQEKI